ncbi:MAG: DNA alkylation repair protein, partial [Promethearchaeota archaeon]
RYKKHFNANTIDLIKEEYSRHCHTWSHCDSTGVRLLGPFLGETGNETLAINTINSWSESNNLWIKRASMVILLKITMMRKDFNNDFVFELVEKMLKFSEANYIEKGIGWLLKTCSKYKPEVIIDYLSKNKKNLSRLILRYASEKLPKEKRAEILNKKSS